MKCVFDSKRIQKDVVLAPYTTYKIGGPADYFVEVASAEELSETVLFARKEGIPSFILGMGANVLVTDKGIRGLVIYNRAEKIRITGNALTAESGSRIEDLIQISYAKGLSGFEHYAGIPSTVGGAVWQNLHFLSPDRERTVFISEVIHGATILDGSGKIKKVSTEFFQFGYDQSILHKQKDIIVLSVDFLLTPRPQEEIRETIRENKEWRAEKHPSLERYPSCGSVFMKIEGVGVGRLIEQAGLKGVRAGGAQVSEQHANFIVNTGGATAEDVLALIGLIQEQVKKHTGYGLETEIRIVGER